MIHSSSTATQANQANASRQKPTSNIGRSQQAEASRQIVKHQQAKPGCQEASGSRQTANASRYKQASKIQRHKPVGEQTYASRQTGISQEAKPAG